MKKAVIRPAATIDKRNCPIKLDLEITQCSSHALSSNARRVQFTIDPPGWQMSGKNGNPRAGDQGCSTCVVTRATVGACSSMLA
jgi:hypothetical protein